MTNMRRAVLLYLLFMWNMLSQPALAQEIPLPTRYIMTDLGLNVYPAAINNLGHIAVYAICPKCLDYYAALWTPEAGLVFLGSLP